MTRPSFQFYPADWKANANLRRCSPAARGVWMDILCLLHDSDEYGLVRWPLKEIARAAAASLAHVKELVDKCVLKGSDTECEGFVYTPRTGRRDGEPVTLIGKQPGPLWFSSRMVRDEYVRTIRGQSSRFGENETEQTDTPKPAPKPAPKPPLSDGSSSSASSSASVDTPSLRSGGARAKRRSGLPDDCPNQDAKDQAVQFWGASARFDLAETIEDEAQQFRDYHLREGTLFADWNAGWRTWYRRTLKDRKANQNKVSAHDKGTAGAALYLAEVERPDRAGHGDRTRALSHSLPANGHGRTQVEGPVLDVFRGPEAPVDRAVAPRMQALPHKR